MWATWCKNCLTMDKTTLESGDVQSALSGYVKIKFQAEDPDAQPAKAVMQKFDAVGLPAYVILRPGLSVGPATSNNLFSSNVLTSVPDNSTGRIRSHSGQMATRPLRGSVDVNDTCDRRQPDNPNRADRLVAVRAAYGHLQRVGGGALPLRGNRLRGSRR